MEVEKGNKVEEIQIQNLVRAKKALEKDKAGVEGLEKGGGKGKGKGLD